MEELKAQSVPAFDYLYSIPKRTWARAYTTYLRYGHNTSNIVESLNASWSDIRCLLPLQIIDAIYLEAMKTVYNRLTIKQRLQSISDILIAKFQARIKTSRQY
jgi:predicted membrane-bound mannosyltransferase